MSRYTIILSTVIRNPIDLEHISQTISVLGDALEWSIDLYDCDQILRVVWHKNASAELVKKLKILGVKSAVLEVFDENGTPLGSGVQS